MWLSVLWLNLWILVWYLCRDIRKVGLDNKWDWIMKVEGEVVMVDNELHTDWDYKYGLEMMARGGGGGGGLECTVGIAGDVGE